MRSAATTPRRSSESARCRDPQCPAAHDRDPSCSPRLNLPQSDPRQPPARRRGVSSPGAGVVPPLGASPAALHRALAAGTSARKPIELFETSGIGCHEAGEIRPFDPQGYVGERNLRPLDRTSRLLVVAAQLALADSGWAPGTLGRAGAPAGAPAGA